MHFQMGTFHPVRPYTIAQLMNRKSFCWPFWSWRRGDADGFRWTLQDLELKEKQRLAAKFSPYGVLKECLVVRTYRKPRRLFRSLISILTPHLRALS